MILLNGLCEAFGSADVRLQHFAFRGKFITSCACVHAREMKSSF